MKYYWQISTVLLLLSCLLVGYISIQTGLFEFGDVSASEKTSKGSNLEAIEIQLKRRERNLNEKELILKEQLSRYEKLIVELRTKLEKKDKEYQATLSDKERDSQKRIADLEKQNKELKESKEKALKDLTQSKEEEIVQLKSEVQKRAEEKTNAYRAMYEKMESKKAAKILDEMEIPIATAILENIKQDKAADILSKMAVERARTITEKANSKRKTSSIKVSSQTDSKVNPALETIPKGGE